MNNQLVWEIIGYAGSALVLVSLLMTSIVKLRIINAVGCIIFSIYALVIHSIPTAVMNIALVCIDVFFLAKMLSAKANFTFVRTTADDPIVQHFCQQFSDDIILYYDTTDISAADQVLVIFDNETIAGVLAGVSEGDRLNLIIEYTTKQYRDCKVGPFVYGKLADSYKKLVYAGSNEKHIAYCKKVGYLEENGEYVKTLQ